MQTLTAVSATLAKLLERALDAALAAAPEAAECVAGIDGAVIELDIARPPARLFFMPRDGRVRVAAAAPRAPDVRLAGGLAALAGLAARDARPGAGRGVELSGNLEIGRRFQSLLRALCLDWESALAPYVGDAGAYWAGRAARAAARAGADLTAALGAAAGEFLREELRAAPDAGEVDDFLRGVDALRDRCARFEARLDRLF